MAEPAAIELDLDSAVPPAEQIRARVATLVHTGRLAPGTRLPSVRALAADLGIAPGTVARAYKELEASGVLEAAGRRGTVVADAPPPPSTEDVRAAVAHAAALARTAGWTREGVLRAVDAAWEA